MSICKWENLFLLETQINSISSRHLTNICIQYNGEKIHKLVYATKALKQVGELAFTLILSHSCFLFPCIKTVHGALLS